jgi:hypothetical protein
LKLPQTKLSSLHWWKNDGLVLFALTAFVVFSRIPFLDAGYGVNYDGWLVAVAARDLAITGEYRFSRPPGHPIQEIFYSFIWHTGPFRFNGVTALLSAVGVLFFALSARVLGCKDYILGSLALAFTPVIFINRSNSIDYLWALSFILGSTYFTLTARPVIAGLLLGVAIGCRITSAAMLIPLSLLFVCHDSTGFKVGDAARFSLVTCLVGGFSFIPVFMKYGWSFWDFTESTRPILQILRLATEDIWGRVGTLALLLSCASLLFQNKLARGSRSIPPSSPKIFLAAWILVIVIYTAGFLRLPALSAYLIPIVPFVILVLATLLSRRVFIYTCIALIFSSFVSFGRSGLEQGLAFSDYAERLKQLEETQRIISFGNSLREKSVIVAGKWLPPVKVNLFETHQGYTLGGNEQPLDHGAVKYVYETNKDQLSNYIFQGFQVYHLPVTQQHTIAKFDFDPLKHGARLKDLDNESAGKSFRDQQS